MVHLLLPMGDCYNLLEPPPKQGSGNVLFKLIFINDIPICLALCTFLGSVCYS